MANRMVIRRIDGEPTQRRRHKCLPKFPLLSGQSAELVRSFLFLRHLSSQAYKNTERRLHLWPNLDSYLLQRLQ
jgi:hypothetical protein